MARTRTRGGAGIFEPALRWMRRKIASSKRHHHIFRGEVRRGPRGLQASGWHHRFMGADLPDRQVVRIQRRATNGTYTADVRMRGGPTGSWYDKPGGSSFFPDNWTPQQVDRTINSAFANSSPVPGTNGRRWRGYADGFRVEGSYHRNGRDWNSAWPIVE